MKTRTITLKIPRWVPTRYQWMKWKKKVKLFFFPPRCHVCDCRLPVEFPRYYKYRTGYHLGAEAYTDFGVRCYGKQHCASCLKNYIHQLNLPTGRCDLCREQNTKVMSYHYNKEVMTITFLWHWWNGRDFCLPCVDDLLDTGKVKNDY
jgi:hypothetical protein